MMWLIGELGENKKAKKILKILIGPFGHVCIGDRFYQKTTESLN